ncbi:SagB/ThcOx family dehydrogenase [bacterium]|nr:SagB/ThcOx family dehydrogenase [bacterium]
MEYIDLVQPKFEENTIMQILNNRRSVRNYKDSYLLFKEVSELLWAVSGKNSDWGGRTAPSAGATYPLEIYLMALKVESLQAGIYHYHFDHHKLSAKKLGDISGKVSASCLGQRMVADAPATIIITADFDRTTSRYGQRGLRYVYMEAGHCGQNLHIVAESMGLGTVMLGAFKDKEVKQVLEIDEDVLYFCPVGKK